MKFKCLIFLVLIFIGTLVISSCDKKKKIDGAYDFIIYESDSDNSNLSDNVIVARYKVEYYNCVTIPDTLIKKGSAYFFSDESDDYIILKKSIYGLSYSEGYFANYKECSEGEQIDISWSYTAINGTQSTTSLGETRLEGLKEYAFVINGWKD